MTVAATLLGFTTWGPLGSETSLDTCVNNDQDDYSQQGYYIYVWYERKGFQRSNITCNSRTSSGLRLGSGGRTGPAAIPIKFIASFMTETSYPLRRARSS